MVRWSLKSRVVSISVAVLAVTIVLMIVVARHYAYVGLKRLLQEQQDNQVALIATQLDDKLELHARILQALAVHLAAEGGAEPHALEAVARDSVAIPSTFDWLMLMSTDGKRVFDTRPHFNPSVGYADRPYFRKVMAGATLAISDPTLGRASGRPVVIIAVPVRRADGQLIGVLNGGIDLQSSNFLSDLGPIGPVRSGSFCLVTRGPHPIYVMHPDASQILGAAKSTGESCGTTEARRLWVFGTPLDPIISQHRLATTDWDLIANLPSDKAYSPFTATRPRLLATSLIALICGALLVYGFVRRLLVPVQHLHRVVLESANEPAAYKALAKTQTGEVGDLARAFASLMQQLTLKTDGLRETGKLAEERKQLIEAIADRIPDLVAYLDLDERYVFANRTYETRFGHPVAQMIGRSVRDVWGPEVYDAGVAPHLALARAGETSMFDYVWQAPAGPLCFEITYMPVKDVDGSVVGIHVFSRDVTQEREELRRIEQTTLVDHLTGLLNRKGFDRRMGDAFERANEGLQPVALLLVDLDDFKDVNDTYGHACGDRLLRCVASRLELCIDESDAVARMGGDEFAVIVSGATQAPDATRSVDAIARKIVASLAEPYDIDGYRIVCQASVGAAVHMPPDNSSTNELFMRADTSLYAAKHAGKGQCAVFDGAKVRAA